MLALPKFVNKTLLRFLLAGVAAFTFEYLIFFSLYSLFGLQLFVANSLSFLCGLILSFSLQRAWTFKKDQFDKSVRKQFLLYGSLALGNLFIINILLGYLTHNGLDPRAGKVMVMLAIVFWNFLLMNRVIFRQELY